MKKILVQFDGSNFYNKVKKISSDLHLTNYDYAGLVHELTQKQSSQIIYYVGEIKKYPGIKKILLRFRN